MSKWVILDFGAVDKDTAVIVQFMCLGCCKEHELPVHGAAVAQAEQGLIFDSAHYAMPKRIRCPKCRQRLELVP